MEGNVVDFEEKRKAKKHEKEIRQPKTGHHQMVNEALCLLSGDENGTPEFLGRFKWELKVVRSNLQSEPLILVIKQDRTAEIITPINLAGQLHGHLSVTSINCPVERFCLYRMKDCEEIVKTWMYDEHTPTIPMPKAMGFKSDPDILFHRLAFDPDLGVESLEDLSTWASTWHEFVMRLQNRDGFCARIGSIFDPEADRKQAVWLSGPKDSGKSQIALQLQKLCGPAFKTLGDSDLKDKFLKYELIGKRVAVMNEVTPSFINTEEFKSLTGDDEHRVRPLGKQGFTARLETLIFFLSNNPPETQSKKELFERIIYCRVDGLPADVTPMGQTAYQALLTSEIAQFIGYCVNVYKNLPGSRLPNNMDELIDVVEEKELPYSVFFDQHFIEGETEECLATDFQLVMNRELKDRRDYMPIKKWISRNKILEKKQGSKRGDRRLRYVGFRPRNTRETVPMISEQQERTGV